MVVCAFYRVTIFCCFFPFFLSFFQASFFQETFRVFRLLNDKFRREVVQQSRERVISHGNARDNFEFQQTMIPTTRVPSLKIDTTTDETSIGFPLSILHYYF